jgi:hypothetical protein
MSLHVDTNMCLNISIRQLLIASPLDIANPLPIASTYLVVESACLLRSRLGLTEQDVVFQPSCIVRLHCLASLRPNHWCASHDGISAQPSPSFENAMCGQPVGSQAPPPRPQASCKLRSGQWTLTQMVSARRSCTWSSNSFRVFLSWTLEYSRSSPSVLDDRPDDSVVMVVCSRPLSSSVCDMVKHVVRQE